jgi:pimeloyl-ACP methyl ester carboxylesterase
LEIFPECGHAVHLEDHEHYREVLVAFLNRVDAAKGMNTATA